MKSKTYEKVLKGTVDKLLESHVNSACWFIVYQPKLPKGAEKFKRK